MPIAFAAPATTPPFDLAGFSFDSSFDMTTITPTARPTGITWNDDGTSAYVTDLGSDSVYQFTLSVPYDFSTGTATYASKSVNVGGQTTNPYDGRWSDDGLRFFIVTTVGQLAYQYNGTVSYDLSTLSYSGSSFDLNNANADIVDPRGIEFNDDGSKMYIATNNGVQGIYEFNLGTNFTISTATYSKVLATPGGQQTSNVVFQPGGKSMSIIGRGSDIVYAYTLSVAYDIATATLSPTSLDTTAQDSIPQGLAWNPDGSQFYVGGFNDRTIDKYTK